MVSAVAYAAPELTVTSVGQYIEIDNDSNTGATKGKADIGEAVHFANFVNLAYDDWSFGLMARKAWYMDTDDGVKSAGHRIDMTATKNFGNYTLGARFRNEKSYDGYYLMGSYKYGMFAGDGYISYRAVNEKGVTDSQSDYWYSELEPIRVNVGPVQLAYYLEAYNYVNDDTTFENIWNHQARIRGKVYTGERLTLGLEYRYQFSDVEERNNNKVSANDSQHTILATAAYKVTENLTVDGYYQYEMNKYQGLNGATANPDDYYGEFLVRWTYKF
ncbi:MAG: hypothetical protein MR673_09615 [Fusobacterium perfoetens]|uniref:hypothetical protein n=1 Tax=Fusobacterium perfoetens TaxID=852 RepID=UPI0023F11133|nr:hypothetical protein [Fusobacterium perfoetens]MCI6153359.1 hypothetical protein [Fusobacterium perfoetens]MDY3237134.1 hypothetical protein [Fusobacterium perfoetens]